MTWLIKRFETLSKEELYQILQLRSEIFVVEQNCNYQDLDGKDHLPDTIHLFTKQDDKIVAYLRLLAPSISYTDQSSFGRVVTHSKVRGQGLGHRLIEKALRIIDEEWPNYPCKISAQSHLQSFYANHGFQSVGEGYLEDNIPHQGMQRLSANSKEESPDCLNSIERFG